MTSSCTLRKETIVWSAWFKHNFEITNRPAFIGTVDSIKQFVWICSTWMKLASCSEQLKMAWCFCRRRRCSWKKAVEGANYRCLASVDCRRGTKPLKIGRIAKPSCFKDANCFTLSVTYEANAKALMSGKLDSIWLSKLDVQMQLKERNVLLLVSINKEKVKDQGETWRGSMTNRSFQFWVIACILLSILMLKKFKVIVSPIANVNIDEFFVKNSFSPLLEINTPNNKSDSAETSSFWSAF